MKKIILGICICAGIAMASCKQKPAGTTASDTTKMDSASTSADNGITGNTGSTGSMGSTGSTGTSGSMGSTAGTGSQGTTTGPGSGIGSSTTTPPSKP